MGWGNPHLLSKLGRQLPQQEPSGAIQLPLGAEVVLLAPPALHATRSERRTERRSEDGSQKNHAEKTEREKYAGVFFWGILMKKKQKVISGLIELVQGIWDFSSLDLQWWFFRWFLLMGLAPTWRIIHIQPLSVGESSQKKR